MSDALDILEQRLAERGCQPRRRGEALQARCPAHDDRSPSLSVSRGSRRDVVLHCHAGCHPAAVMAALGLAWSELGGTPAGSDTSAAEYLYADADGRPLYKVVRRPGKRFSQHRMTPTGEWIANMDGVPKVLYRLPEVLAAVRDGRTVYVCEGEKDADRVRAEGVVATCNSGGAGQFLASHADTLAGASVVVIADRDAAGAKHAAQVRRLLEARRCSVRVVESAVGKDAYDHLSAGRTLDELVEHRPPAADDEKDGAPAPGLSQLDGVPAEWTDSAVAEAFARHIGGRYCYAGDAGRWYRWDGRRWADDRGEAVHEEARQWIVGQRKALIDARAGADAERAARRYASRASIESVVALARRIDGIVTATGTFDRDRHLLNVANGIVDLRTGELLEHDPERYMTKLADVDYRPGATHPDVDTLLLVLDDDVREYARRAFGYAATGETDEHVVLVLDGAGANGKSTLLGALQAVLGDYAGPAPSSLVMATRFDQHPADKALLRGMRLVSVSETEDGGQINAVRLKELSGGDAIVARQMRENFSTFEPTHTLVIATNHKPRIDGTDEAAWRRLRLIPFPHTYVDADIAAPGDRVKDKRLAGRLQRGARQREALLAWVVSGAVDYHADGLTRCATVDSLTDDWRLTMDTTGRFVGECLDLAPGLTLSGSELYGAYQEWCRAEGHQPKSNTRFASEFLEHRLVKERVAKRNVHGSVRYSGVGRRSRSDAAFALTTTGEVGAGGGSEVKQNVSSRVGLNQQPSTYPHPRPQSTLVDTHGEEF